jgi:pimeloyl-ACP methyl ester carboxylesterase
MRSSSAILCLLALALAAVAAGAAENGTVVRFETDDGVELVGHLFGTGPVGVILAHMYPADQTSWFEFARLLAERGYTALTFDFRGYGESSGEKTIALIDRDLTAAYRFLSGKVRQIVLVGASMGGTAALKVASREPVAAVITISSPLAFRGLEAAFDLPRVKVPKLFIAGIGDRHAARTVKRMMDSAPDPKERELYDSPEHGTNLFRSGFKDDLTRRLLDFIATHAPLEKGAETGAEDPPKESEAAAKSDSES